jgi:hypothetical protein
MGKWKIVGLSHLIQLLEVLCELVFWVKVFRLFRLEQIFFGVRTVYTVGKGTTSYLLAGPACL